jgi:cysteinyl-tRNA synthetase
MIRAHLGETIDIHGGGIDLIFPHHENEIAQSRSAHGGAPLARFWVHNGFVDMGSEKMSKSLGNIITPAELLEQGHRGETLRLALLSMHYRKPLPWTEDLVERSRLALQKWYGVPLAVFETLDQELAALVLADSEPSGEMVEALSDDLNTAEAIAWLHRSANEIHDLQADGQNGEAIRRTLQFHADGKMLGLEIRSDKSDLFLKLREVLSEEERRVIEACIAERSEAKKNRDFATADRIRDELKAEGIVLEDGPAGTTWRKE